MFHHVGAQRQRLRFEHGLFLLTKLIDARILYPPESQYQAFLMEEQKKRRPIRRQLRHVASAVALRSAGAPHLALSAGPPINKENISAFA